MKLKSLYLCLVLSLAISFTACSKQKLVIKEEIIDTRSETERLYDLTGSKDEAWVFLVMVNTASSEIDFSYFDKPENSAAFIVAPGSQEGDDITGESNVILGVPKNLESKKYYLIDNISGATWDFYVKPTYKSVILTVSDGEPYNVDIRYL
ncbi:MAG: hypothetical protein AAB373_06045 [Patescibacteria group bacterium]